jgi:hypothetical protein
VSPFLAQEINSYLEGLTVTVPRYPFCVLCWIAFDGIPESEMSQIQSAC